MISIIVVTYNRLEYTKQCIDSILRNTDVPYELRVIDNGSTDGTQNWLMKNIPKIVLYYKNVGCAEAYNIGFRMAKGDPIFRIDNDVILPSGWASAFMKLWDSDPKIGMMNTALETEPSEHPERVFVSSDLDINYFNNPVWHDGGLGSWCIAHRKAMFDEIGHYRNDFGLFALNDNDLEKRAQNAGWKLATIHGIRVGHLWKMDTEEERIYNTWKFAEQAKQIEVWKQIWGGKP